MRTAVLAVAVVTLFSAPLAAQSIEPQPSRLSFDVAGGMQRYGPHAFGGLEVAMNRWLALRTEALFTLHSRSDWPAHRMTALTFAGVASLRSDKRVSPYLLGGLSNSFAQGGGIQHGLMGGAGLRFRLGGVQPFVEIRAQRRIGVPISFGIRF